MVVHSSPWGLSSGSCDLWVRDVDGGDKKAKAETIPWDQGGVFSRTCWFSSHDDNIPFFMWSVRYLCMMIFKIKARLGECSDKMVLLF